MEKVYKPGDKLKNGATVCLVRYEEDGRSGWVLAHRDWETPHPYVTWALYDEETVSGNYHKVWSTAVDDFLRRTCYRTTIDIDDFREFKRRKEFSQ